MKKQPKKPYWEMNLEELRTATAEFDREFIADEFRPLTASERAQWERAKRKQPGRPRTGSGAKVVSVSIEQSLLDRADRMARKHGVTRASLVARGLRAVLASEKSKPASSALR